MKDFAEFLGWITVISYAIALFNYIFKYINRNYLKKFTNKKAAGMYKFIMKYVVKYHKLVGIIAVIALTAHFIIMYTLKGLLITGLIAMILMFSVVLLGIYGTYINKKLKAPWLKIHKILAFTLIVAIIVHIL